MTPKKLADAYEDPKDRIVIFPEPGQNPKEKLGIFVGPGILWGLLRTGTYEHIRAGEPLSNRFVMTQDRYDSLIASGLVVQISQKRNGAGNLVEMPFIAPEENAPSPEERKAFDALYNVERIESLTVVRNKLASVGVDVSTDHLDAVGGSENVAIS